MLKRLIFTAAFSLLTVTALDAETFAESQAKVKEKYPAEFAEIQKLAASDMSAAQKKLHELARKGNISLPREGRSNFRNFPRLSGDRRGRGGRPGMGPGFGARRMGQFNLLRRFIAESQIKSKFAAEYAAADREFLAAVEKIEALAKQAKVTLPLSTEIQIRKLRAKAPAEFAALEEQSASDPGRAFAGLRELAEKHKIEIWEMRGNSRGQGNSGERPAPPPAASRENPRQIIRRLQKKYPQEMKRIMKLREEDPRAFSSELQKLNRRDQAETK